jgi:diguanylate cyclase (GGDEF)-like protein
MDWMTARHVTDPVDGPCQPPIGGDLQVLMIADRAETATLLGHMLRLAPLPPSRYEVARDLRSGLRQLTRARPDAVLLELGAEPPGPLGPVARLSAVASDVPVIAVAGIEDEEAGLRAVREGAQDYVVREHVTPHLLARAIRCGVERQRQLTALRALSLIDPLTGLYNRRAFVAMAEGQLRMARRTHRRSVVICADLDDLKDINDRLGHLEGDRVISSAARALRASFRESDVVARLGGDEFAAFAYDVADGAEHVMVERVAGHLAAAYDAGSTPCRVGLSIGVAATNGKATTLDALLRRADVALYGRKRAPAARVTHPPVRMAAAGQWPEVVRSGGATAVVRGRRSEPRLGPFRLT